MKIPKLTLVATNLLILLPIAAGLILWDQIPDRVPIHFDINGHPNGWGGKFFGIIGIPLILLAVQLLYQVTILITTKLASEKVKLSPMITEIALWLMPVILLLAEGAVLFSALGNSGAAEIGRYVCLIPGAVITVVGNYLPKCRQNPYVGIKVPWTLADKDNWAYTHRVGGWVWTIGGLLGMLFTFLDWIVALVSVIALAVIIPIIASYLYSRRKRAK